MREPDRFDRFETVAYFGFVMVRLIHDPAEFYINTLEEPCAARIPSGIAATVARDLADATQWHENNPAIHKRALEWIEKRMPGPRFSNQRATKRGQR